MAYSEKEIDTIFKRIINAISIDNMSLRAALRMNGMPTSETFFKWIDADKDKTIQYVRACEERADNIFEEILEIADDSSNDVRITEDGIQTVNSEIVQRSKLRVDARKWMLGKMNPKKYGDRNTTTLEIEEVKPIFNLNVE